MFTKIIIYPIYMYIHIWYAMITKLCVLQNYVHKNVHVITSSLHIMCVILELSRMDFSGQTRVLCKCLAWNFDVMYLYVLRMIYSYGRSYCGEKCVLRSYIFSWRKYLSWGNYILEIICTYLVLEEKNTCCRGEPEISQTFFWKYMRILGCGPDYYEH